MATAEQTAYLAARKLGRKYLSENSGKASRGYLRTLSDFTKEKDIVGEINLGVHELPINKVIGTRTSGRSSAFAGNFMPLLGEDSEFAAKWRSLYKSHISEGIREPIKVFEYINRYFVQEGNKRVSVLNYVGAVSVFASVTRILPMRDESNTAVSIYYEFLDFDKRAVFGNLWFSRKGNFTRLAEHMRRYQELHPEVGDTELPQLINATYSQFRSAYKRANLGDFDFTTGDALVEYCNIFGPPYGRDQREILENIRAYRSQLVMLTRAEGPITIESVRPREIDLAPSFFRRKPMEKVRAAFAFESTPDELMWTMRHDHAIRRIERMYGDRLESIKRYNVPRGTRGYAAMAELLEEKPDIIFATSPHMEDAALRITLENPGTIVLNCNRVQERKNLSTYFDKSYELSFLCGVVSGAMTRTNRLGFMTLTPFKEHLTGDVNAFARGAMLVNPKARVFDCLIPNRNSLSEYANACSRFADSGCDIAFCQYMYSNPANLKIFPGIYGHVYLLNDRTRLPDECLAAACCDWTVFYEQVITGFLSDRGKFIVAPDEGYAVHFGWGIDTGMLDIFGVDAFVGHNATSLLKIFRDLVSEGGYHPMTGPISDANGVLRIEYGVIPTLEEIQSMDWHAEGVTLLGG